MQQTAWADGQLNAAVDLFSKGIGSHDFFKALEESLPPVFTRQTASKAVGGLVSVKSLSNADSLGCGPKGRVWLGSRVGYTRDSFLSWLKAKIRTW